MTAAVAIVGGKAFRSYHRKLDLSARTSEEPTALLLSGGGSLGFFHLGVIRVLFDNGLLPKVMSGASAGASMAALICTRTERQVRALVSSDGDLLALAGELVSRPVATPGSQNLSALTRDWIARIVPDVTFAEAEELSGRALNISVTALDGAGGLVCGPRTTPDVLVRDAVLASGAVPRVFAPVALRERTFGRVREFADGRRWVDGSIFADIPSREIKRRYGVRHTIVSLVNPLARPFIADHRDCEPSAKHRALKRVARSSMLGWISWGRACAASVPGMHEVFDTAYRLMHQDYSGDLMVTPSRRYVPLNSVLDIPSREMIRALSADGEARTTIRLEDLKALAESPPGRWQEGVSRRSGFDRPAALPSG